jgi:hypothetical protein
MTIDDLRNEFINWRFTKYKLINFLIGLSALLVYEFLARPYYRPYIYSNHINDFHVADTLGNSLGTIAAIFITLALLTNDKTNGFTLIKIITASGIIYEIAQPLVGKLIDPWDILATILTGLISFVIYKLLFDKWKAAERGKA